MKILQESKAYKPFSYPWAYDAWKQQQQIHWIAAEVNMGDDIKDWSCALTDKERNFLTKIFRFFTQSDIDVSSSYIDLYLPKFKPVEIRMMLASFLNMETVHIEAYALLIESLGMPDSEFSEFLNYQVMVDKHDFNKTCSMETPRQMLKSLAIYGAFTEGLQLFASFAMLLNFPRFGKMKGMGQIITWSVRDESLHIASLIKLFHTVAEESGCLDADLKDEIVCIGRRVVEIEDDFIDLAFEMGNQQNLTSSDLKLYIRYIFDWRLQQLGIKPVYVIREHPMPWLLSMLNGIEMANFFETRVTEYGKCTTSGTWDDVWEG